jgi:small subunit ribosomal protein S25e
MGGVKKKPLGSSDKTTSTTTTPGPAGDIKTAKKEDPKKTGAKPQQKQKLSVFIEEPQGMRALQSMRAITIQSLARTTGVKISVANAFIKSLEGKGLVKRVGGYSGHRVYKLENSN